MKLKNFILVALALAPTAAIASPIRLSAAGATFPATIYQRWFSDLSKTTDLRVNYQSVGSGAGRKAFLDETVSFAASDDPLKDKDRAKVARGAVQIPVVGGTIAIAYNNPSCKLKLTQKQAVSVFMGSINNWKQLGCSDGKITVVHRSDGSGTTAAFTESMQAFSSEWTLGTGKSVDWKVGVGGKGNEGVSGIIQTTSGSIGYINQSFVKGVVKASAVQNKSGEFVYPNYVSGSKALNGIVLDKNLAGQNPNPSAKGAYPIATLTYILAYKTGNGSKTDAIKSTINYMLSDKAQAVADDMGYVPLKDSILDKSRAAVNLIKE